MKHCSILCCIACFICLCTTQKAFAQTQEKDPTIYAFGYSTSFNDSVVYLTQIQELTGAKLEKGTNFLIDRARYATQLRTYLESRFWGHETAVIFFSEKKKQIEKKLQKVRREQQKKTGIRMIEIPASDFQFQSLDQKDYSSEQLQ